MATFTANYNLRKPAGGDLVTVSSDINANMDIIDAELDDHEDRLDAVETEQTVLGDLFVVVNKAVTETVTNSTTLQNDDELFYDIPEAGTYIIDFYLTVSGTAAGDIKIRLQWNNGTLSVQAIGPETTGAGSVATPAINPDGTSPSSELNFGIGPVNNSIHIHCLYVATGTGTFRLQWAQLVGGAATDAKVESGSNMIIQKVR